MKGSETTRFSLSYEGDWPTCFYDSSYLCGDPKTRGVSGAMLGTEVVRRGWHIADMCDCPSCPLRVAVHNALEGDKG